MEPEFVTKCEAFMDNEFRWLNGTSLTSNQIISVLTLAIEKIRADWFLNPAAKVIIIILIQEKIKMYEN